MNAIVAEFASEQELLAVARALRDKGVTRCDFFSPFPVEGLDELIGQPKSPLGHIAFAGGAFGFVAGAAMEFIPASWLYPLMVAGRQGGLALSPTFLPIIFEMTILCATIATVVGMLVLNGLPRWNHPLFEWDRFSRVSDDGFFAAIGEADPQFADARGIFTALGATRITEVREP